LKNDIPPNVQERKILDIPLDIAELKKSNVLITGTNQQGKSRLAMAISDTLHIQGIADNWQIICFDNVGHWRHKSSIPHYLEISENSLRYVLPKEERVVYILSKADFFSFIFCLSSSAWSSSPMALWQSRTYSRALTPKRS
jgi:hypothetical protein